MVGVPVAFLARYKPDQFDVLGLKGYEVQTRKYEIQVQIDKSRKKSSVTKHLVRLAQARSRTAKCRAQATIAPKVIDRAGALQTGARSNGGKTVLENCQMLCKVDNRTKSGT